MVIAILTWHSLVQVSLDIQELKELSHGQKDIKMDRQFTHAQERHGGMPESVTTLGRLVRNEVPQVVTLVERIALIMTIQGQL